MARRQRRDAPGRFHHIFNRASRRRVLFSDQRDYRYFLMLIACAVRRGELVVHAHCLLSTHFHLLAASPSGRISYAMMRVQNAYARYHNRRYREDGSVSRGQFGSRPVGTLLYYVTLLRYIAANPVQAGIANEPLGYAYSSARHFTSGPGPKWFDRSAVMRILGWEDAAGRPLMKYAKLIAARLSEHEVEVVERRMSRPRCAEDELDQLFRAPPAFLANWMARKIKSDGGRSPWEPVASCGAIMQAVDELRALEGPWRVRIGRNSHDGWALLETGLLQTLACVTTDVAARRLGIHGATASRRARLHREQVGRDRNYAMRAGAAARAAIDSTFPKHRFAGVAAGSSPGL